MKLLINGDAIEVRQMGPDFILLENGAKAPAGEGTMVLQVDESESRWDVTLPVGTLAGSEGVLIARCR